MKKYLFPIILLSLLALPFAGQALNLSYPSMGGINLGLSTSIEQLVAWFYYFFVAISGLGAFVMLVAGGFKWMSSAGNPNEISEAKDIISNAILGMIVILASFLILRVINPDILSSIR